jgi:hypothetical protein
VIVSVRKKTGSRCVFYYPPAGAFVRRACSRPLYFAARGSSKWTAVIPRRALARGGYAIASRARNSAGTLERVFERFRDTRAIYVRTARPKAKARPPAK